MLRKTQQQIITSRLLEKEFKIRHCLFNDKIVSSSNSSNMAWMRNCNSNNRLSKSCNVNESKKGMKLEETVEDYNVKVGNRAARDARNLIKHKLKSKCIAENFEKI